MTYKTRRLYQLCSHYFK